MVKRRSMETAFALNPDKLAFIHGEDAGVEAGEEIQPADRSLDKAGLGGQEPGPSSPPVKRRGRRPKAAPTPPIADPVILNRSDSGDFLPLLVSLTTRLSPATAEALRRAALEQRLKRRRPHTQQEIVEAAVRHWLTTNGFLRAA
jgi:hypothetical protein